MRPSVSRKAHSIATWSSVDRGPALFHAGASGPSPSAARLDQRGRSDSGCLKMMISGMTMKRFVEEPIVGNRHSCLSALTIRKPVRVTTPMDALDRIGTE